MIISVSRRTDIPALYSKWFMNRLKEGFVLTRNPMNYKQISYVSLKPEDVTCLVFWTKNPEPMIQNIEELVEYNYYFQITVTPYGEDFESNLPPKDVIIDSLKILSNKIGKKKIIWRYDPIIITETYSEEFHLLEFENMCKKLNGCTDACIVSFMEKYKKINRFYDANNIIELDVENKIKFLAKLNCIASNYNITLKTCASEIDYTEVGLRAAKCIDDELILDLFNIQSDKKDINQRKNCGCVMSKDIGSYNTCVNGCSYCYANSSKGIANTYYNEHDVNSELLGLRLSGDENISKQKSSKVSQQISLF